MFDETTRTGSLGVQDVNLNVTVVILGASAFVVSGSFPQVFCYKQVLTKRYYSIKTTWWNIYTNLIIVYTESSEDLDSMGLH